MFALGRKQNETDLLWHQKKLFGKTLGKLLETVKGPVPPAQCRDPRCSHQYEAQSWGVERLNFFGGWGCFFFRRSLTTKILKFFPEFLFFRTDHRLTPPRIFTLGPLVTFQWLLLIWLRGFWEFFWRDAPLTLFDHSYRLKTMWVEAIFLWPAHTHKPVNVFPPQFCLCPKEIDHWVVVSNILCFHPETWGKDPIWRGFFPNGLKPRTRISIKAKKIKCMFRFDWYLW